MEDKINALIDDIRELKELNKEVVKLMQDNAVLEEKLNSSNAKHDEGRKVLHKRLDVFMKIAFWMGATLVTGMAGVIFALVQEVYKS
jgi:uncharacterized protein YlxW (UPF0749 family)